MDVEQQDVLVGTAVSSTTARGSRVGKKNQRDDRNDRVLRKDTQEKIVL